jgi:hypothetical protein
MSETENKGGVLVEWDGGYATVDTRAEAEKVIEEKLAEWKKAGDPGRREDFKIGRNAPYEPAEIQERLERLGLKSSVQPSGISGSPFQHVYVFLSDKEFEGEFILITPREEVEVEDGFLVAVYPKEGEEPYDQVVDECDTLDEVAELSCIVEAAAR